MTTFIDLMYGGSRWELRTFGGGGGDTQSTQYTSSLPEYAEPFYTQLMGQAEGVSAEPYQAYGGPRIAGFDPAQQQAFAGSEQLYAAGNPALAAGVSSAAAGTGAALGQVTDPNFLYSTYGAPQQYNPLGFTPEDLQNLTMDPSSMYINPQNVGTGNFDADIRDQYMSPYQSAVTENSISRAVSDAQIAQKYRDSAAVQAGAFGGDRRFIQDQMAERELLDRVSDLRVEGTQSAFQNAQMQFERDRTARLQADLANQGAGVQAGATNIGSMIQAGGLNQDAVLQALGLGEISRQFGSEIYEQGVQYDSELDARIGQYNNQYSLDAIQSLYGGSEMLGQLGMSDQEAWQQRLGQLYESGEAQQLQTQAGMDTAYQDFINQRDYERNSLTWLSGILHGVPVSAESNVLEYQQSPSLMNQAVGSGIAGLGLYQSMQG